MQNGGRSFVAVSAAVGTAIVVAFILGAVPLALVAALVPWVWAAARRYGYAVACAMGLLFSFAVFSFSMVITSALGLPITTAIVVWALIAGAGLRVMFSTQPSQRFRRIPVVLAALSGSLVWAVFQAISSSLPAYERLGWVMRNDSMTNLILARSFLRNDGIALGGNANPAPIPSGLVATFMLSGRDAVASPCSSNTTWVEWRSPGVASLC